MPIGIYAYTRYKYLPMTGPKRDDKRIERKTERRMERWKDREIINRSICLREIINRSLGHSLPLVINPGGSDCLKQGPEHTEIFNLSLKRDGSILSFLSRENIIHSQLLSLQLEILHHSHHLHLRRTRSMNRSQSVLLSLAQRNRTSSPNPRWTPCLMERRERRR